MCKVSLLLLVSAVMQAPLASTQSLQALQEFSVTMRVNSVAMDVDKGYAVSCGDDEQLYLWNLTTGTADQTMTTGTTNDCDGVGVDFMSMQALAVYGGSNDLKIWDLSTGMLNRTIAGVSGFADVLAVDFSTMMAVTRTGTYVHVWDLNTGMANQTMTTNPNDAKVDFDRMEAVTVDLGGRIRLWDMVEGTMVREVDLSRNKLQTVAVDFAARRAITAGDDGTAWFINLDDMTIIGQNMSNHSNGIRKVVADFTLMRAITGSIDGTAVYWDLSTTSPIYTLQHGAVGGSSFCCTVQFITADFANMLAVTSGNDGQVAVWDLSNGNVLARETRHGARVRSMVADMSKAAMFTGGNNDANTKVIYWSFATTTTTTTMTTGTSTTMTMTMTGTMTSTATATTMTTTTMTTMTTTTMTTMMPTTTGTLLVVTGGSARTSPGDLLAVGLAGLVLGQAFFALSAPGTPKF